MLLRCRNYTPPTASSASTSQGLLVFEAPRAKTFHLGLLGRAAARSLQTHCEIMARRHKGRRGTAVAAAERGEAGELRPGGLRVLGAVGG